MLFGAFVFAAEIVLFPVFQGQQFLLFPPLQDNLLSFNTDIITWLLAGGIQKITYRPKTVDVFSKATGKGS